MPQNLNMDLTKTAQFTKAFTARMGDAGEQLQVTLFDNSLPFTPASNAVVSLKVVTPSNKLGSVVAQVAGNIATFTLDTTLTSEAGYYKRAYIEVKTGDVVRTTQDIVFFSLGNSDLSNGQANMYVAQLDELIKEFNERFDDWLAERTSEYNDLLAKIDELNHHLADVTQDVNTLQDALENAKLNTANLFDVSKITAILYDGFVNKTDTGFIVRTWAYTIMNNTATNEMLEPDTTYTASYKVRVLSANRTTFSTSDSQGGLLLYSGVSGYPTVTVAKFPTGTFDNAEVGDVFEVTKTFTTPSALDSSAAGYRLIAYPARGNEATTPVHDGLSYEDLQIQKGTNATGYQVSSDDTLRKQNERNYNPNVFPDPLMTGSVPFDTDAPSTFTATYSTGGYLNLNNVAGTARARVYWSATKMGLAKPFDKQPYNYHIEARVTSGTATLEIGYSGQTNPVKTITSADGWTSLDGTIQAITNTALCIYVSAGVSVDIRVVYLYPAATDVTSVRIEDIEATINAPLPQLSSTDFNSINYTSELLVQGANAPLGDTTYYFYLTTQVWTTDNIHQRAIRRTGNNTTAYEFARQKVNGTWLPWYEIPRIGGGVTLRDLTAELAGTPDNMLYTGWGYAAFTSGSPTSATVIIRTFAATTGTIYQELFAVTAGSNWQRFRRNGAWSDWITTTYGNLQDLDRQVSGIDMNTLLSNWEGMVLNPDNSTAPSTGNSTFYVVVRRYGGAYVKQVATNATNGVEYTRFLVASTWGEWYITSNAKNDGTLPSKPTGTDLNNCKRTDTFMVSSPANAPQSGQIVFYVEVLAYLTTYCKQTATAIGTADNTYTRQQTGADTWTPWKLVTKA